MSTNDQNSVSENVPLTAVSSARVTDENGREKIRTSNDVANNENETTDYNPEAALTNNSVLAEVVPDGFNVYRNKKTLTQGLMDIALFSANANQLRYILDNGATNKAFYYIAAALIIFSLILQIGVGLLLLMSTQYNVSVACQRQIAYRYGNYVVVGIFLITVVNIFIAAFGGPAVAFPVAVSSFLPSVPIINNSTVGT